MYIRKSIVSWFFEVMLSGDYRIKEQTHFLTLRISMYIFNKQPLKMCFSNFRCKHIFLPGYFGQFKQTP